MPSHPALSDLKQSELVYMCDAHEDAAFGLLIEHHPAMRQGDDFYDFLSGLNHPYANMVFGMKVPDPRITVADITMRLQESRAPAYWWVGPCTRPENISTILCEHGWKLLGDVPCMVIDLDKLEIPEIPGLEIKEVRTPEELRDWQEVFSQGYEVPLAVSRILAPALDGRIRLFTALLNGKAVGTTGIFVHLGVPGVYCVSTLKEFRGRGIGAAITGMPLIEARKSGYRIGTLQASELGYPVYKRIGFQDVCQLQIYTMNI